VQGKKKKDSRARCEKGQGKRKEKRRKRDSIVLEKETGGKRRRKAISFFLRREKASIRRDACNIGEGKEGGALLYIFNLSVSREKRGGKRALLTIEIYSCWEKKRGSSRGNASHLDKEGKRGRKEIKNKKNLNNELTRRGGGGGGKA